MDKIDEFFGQYPDFDYDRTESSPREFYRMCDLLGWEKDSQGRYPRLRNEAHEEFRRAMVENFNDIFGTNVNDQAAWESMCVTLRIEPIPDTISDMKEVRFTTGLCYRADQLQAVLNTHVNLSDLQDSARSAAKLTIFKSQRELAEYTKRTGRFFPKEEAYAGGLLRFLLREITGTYEGHAHGGKRGKKSHGRKKR